MTFRAGAPPPQAPHTAASVATPHAMTATRYDRAIARPSPFVTRPPAELTSASAPAAIRLLSLRGSRRWRHDVAVGKVRHVDRAGRRHVVRFARDGRRQNANAIVWRQSQLCRARGQVDGVDEDVARDGRLVARAVRAVGGGPP